MKGKFEPEKYNLDLSNNLTESKINIDKDFDKNEIVIPFWINDPNILFQQQYIFEFFPTETMTYEQKLNTITRTVIILTIICFLFTKSYRILIIGTLTVSIIYIVYYYHELEKSKIINKKNLSIIKEGFSSPVNDFLQDNNISIPNNVFQQPDSNNPFSNVLMTDYDYNPNKKPAPPSFNNNINKQILAQAKQSVIDSNPDQPDIADKLFRDLGEQLVFEQSMRPFYSNPGTTIPNDQGAFAEFCYGSMISCKEGNAFACARNLSRHTNS
jgi:hypothetical protein